MARHASTLSYADLFRSVKVLLAETGVFSAVIPFDNSGEFISEGYIAGLYLYRKIAVKTVANKPVKRFLLAFGKQPKDILETESVCLHRSGGMPSEWYGQLTKQFYLDK